MFPYNCRIDNHAENKLQLSPAPHVNRGHLPRIINVLDFQGASYASDVYSFGMVV